MQLGRVLSFLTSSLFRRERKNIIGVLVHRTSQDSVLKLEQMCCNNKQDDGVMVTMY